MVWRLNRWNISSKPVGIFAPNARKRWVATEKANVIEVAALVNSPTDKPPDI